MIEPLFDFEVGDFCFTRLGDVKLVTGKEELKNQIRKILNTPLGRHEIYDGSSWGTRIEELFVGQRLPREYLKSEIERCIREALSTLEGVKRADSFDILQKGATLTIHFVVHSIYGSFENEEILKITD